MLLWVAYLGDCYNVCVTFMLLLNGGANGTNASFRGNSVAFNIATPF
jgi:hypothetical protein